MTQPDPKAHPTFGFIVAPLDGPPTGGTLYNAHLIDALRSAGARCRVWTLENAHTLCASDATEFWIDSLYLESIPRLRAQLDRAKLGLLLHYLPSLVRIGRSLHRDELTAAERVALQAVDSVISTSPFMTEQLAALGYPRTRVRCIEPGVDELGDETSSRGAAAHVRAAMLCSVVEAKGVLPFLDALASLARPGDRFSIRIAGTLMSEPEYAEHCRARIVTNPQLRERVELLGPLPHAQALSLLHGSDLLLSASRMESYGMALAEARALGIPIIAHDGGHARAHIDAAAGGILVKSSKELARAFLGVARNREALDLRRVAAQEHRLTRTWAVAAQEFAEGTRG